MHFVNAKSILSPKNGINIYRGCSHGCIYCDSRSICYNMNHRFEDIEVKENAPELLKTALMKKRQKFMIGTGSMTDPYIPIEKDLRCTRKCIEIIDEMNFGLTILTKSSLILRDLDILKNINKNSKCVVQMTMTTFDEKLCKTLEPNVSATYERFRTLETLRDEKIPTVVWLCPILPYINDSEENLNGILDYCIRAGVKGIICYGFGMTLRDGSRDYFYQKLDEHFPGLKERYIREFGDSYIVTSPNNQKLTGIFKNVCRKHGIMTDVKSIFKYLNTYEDKNFEQLGF